MSMMEIDFLYSRQFRQDTPAWYRRERYDYCEKTEGRKAERQGFFARHSMKKQNHRNNLNVNTKKILPV